jgi:hypothetical protein
MFRKLSEIVNGEWIKLVIDNFDPYGAKERTDIELNKQHNEELKLNNKEK